MDNLTSNLFFKCRRGRLSFIWNKPSSIRTCSILCALFLFSGNVVYPYYGEFNFVCHSTLASTGFLFSFIGFFVCLPLHTFIRICYSSLLGWVNFKLNANGKFKLIPLVNLSAINKIFIRLFCKEITCSKSVFNIIRKINWILWKKVEISIKWNVFIFRTCKYTDHSRSTRTVNLNIDRLETTLIVTVTIAL